MTTIVRRGAKWLVAVDHGRSDDGKRLRRWHTLDGELGKREVKAAAAKLEADAKATYGVVTTKLTVSELLDRWLEASRSTVSPKTHERYGELAAGIKLQLGRVRVDRLKPADISRAWARAAVSGRRDGRGGLGARTVHHLHTVLKTALSWAVDHELLVRNPALKATAPRVEKLPTTTYSLGDVSKLVAHLKADRIFIAVYLLAMTGCRRAEACALRWHSVDLANARLRIEASIEQLNCQIRTKSTKSGRARTVALGASVVEVLREHRRRQEAEYELMGMQHSDDALVCSHPGGGTLHPRWLTKQWTKAVRASGLTPRNLHHLRHAHATALLQAGEPIKVVSERLGHSTTGITLDIYGHVLPGMQEDAAARFDQAFKAIEHSGNEP